MPVRSELAFTKYMFLSINSWEVLNFNVHYELADIKRKYYVRLRELCYLGDTSKFQTQRVREDFANYYGEEFLCELGCNIESGQQNWLLKTLGSNVFRHPIKQLLVIIFLFGSFGNFRLSSEKYTPFGESPWLCLNPLSDHYKKPVIQKYEFRKIKRKEYGVFSCDCGFVYSREISVQPKPEDVYSHILSFGSNFEERLNELSQKRGVSNKELLNLLGLSQYAIRGSMTGPRAGRAIDMSLKAIYRDVIRGLQESNPAITRSQIIQKARKEYRWLRQYDKEWSEKHLPERSRVLPSGRRFANWEKLDNNMCARLHEEAQNIRSQQGKPRRVTKERLVRGISAHTMLKHKTGYPKSLKLLDDIAESREDYQIRCIDWAMNEIRNIGVIDERAIRDMTSIRQDASSKVTAFIKEIVAKVGEVPTR